MPKLPLNVRDGLPRIGLVPTPVKVLRDETKLDDEVARQIFRLDFAALLAPEAKQRGLIIAHDDSRIRAADEAAPMRRIGYSLCLCVH